MRGTPTMTTEQYIRQTLQEAHTHAPDSLDRAYLVRTAERLAEMIASRLDETRTADEVLRDAMTEERKAA